MKRLLQTLFVFSTLLVTAHAQTQDGTQLDQAALQEKWKNLPPNPPTGLRTRGIGATPPAVQTRSISLSADAMQINAGTLSSLTPRGLKVLKGADAAHAQKLQDSSSLGATSPQEDTPNSKRPAPAAVIQVPVIPAKQIAFRLQFKLNSTEFADTALGAQQVRTIAEAMKGLPENTCFLLEGHTCDLGDDFYNQKLSENRALAVRTLLAGYGVKPSRLLAAGFGESQLAVPNSKETNRAVNRRVMIGPMELALLP